jgi:CHAT domain-containing protein
VLQNGNSLTDEMVRGSEVGPKVHPFLFLNACDAGTAGDELGMAGGLVGSALEAGFRGCVGPFWSIASETARQVAEEFYKLTLERGEPVGAALRTLRGRFGTGGEGTVEDTWLAYVFYGHPALRLKRAN